MEGMPNYAKATENRPNNTKGYDGQACLLSGRSGISKPG